MFSFLSPKEFNNCTLALVPFSHHSTYRHKQGRTMRRANLSRPFLYVLASFAILAGFFAPAKTAPLGTRQLHQVRPPNTNEALEAANN